MNGYDAIKTGAVAVMRTSISSRVVRTQREFEQLKLDWDRLCDYEPFRAPFYSWLWHSLWWKHFGKGKSLFAVVVEDDQQGVVGIAPLMKQRRSIRGVPVTELAFAANGITPRSAILVSSRLPMSMIVKEVIRCLAMRRQEWDMATLTNMDAAMPSTGAILEQTREYGLVVIQTRGRTSPFASIAGDFNAFWSSKFNSKRRNNIRRSLKMLNERGKYHVIDYTATSDMEEALRLAFQVSARSWKGRIGSHMNGSRACEAFYRAVTMSFAEKGHVRIWIAFLDSQPVAMEYYLTCGKKLYFLVNDFDHKYGTLSPGTVLLFKVLEQLHEERRIDELDFGGDAYEYKMKWATGVRPHLSFELFNDRTYSRLLHLTKSVVLPRMRRLRRALTLASDDS